MIEKDVVAVAGLKSLCQLRKYSPTAMLELGKSLNRMRAQEQWRHWNFCNFALFVQHYCSFSISTANKLMRIASAHEAGTLTSGEIKSLNMTRLLALLRQRNHEREGTRTLIDETLEQADSKKLGPPSQPATVYETLAGQIAAAPMRRLVPPPGEFSVSASVWKQIFVATQIQQHVLLTGPSGCGKTELIQHAAEAFGQSIEVFQFSAMSDARAGLIGCMQFTDGATRFVESRFVRAIQRPGIILLDELNRCSPDAANIILSLLDGQRRLPLDEAGEKVVHVADGVTFVATANIGPAYSNTETIDRALADRFATHIPLTFPGEDAEVAILSRRTRSNASDVRPLVRFANRQRVQANDGAFTTFISTRSLLAAAEQMRYGISMRDAMKFAVINLFSNDEERFQLYKLAEGMFGANQ